MESVWLTEEQAQWRRGHSFGDSVNGLDAGNCRVGQYVST
jgi:hypothetical protein